MVFDRFLFLSVYFVGYGEFLASVTAAGCQHAAAVSGLHAMAEAMLVVALAVVGLECSLHFVMSFLYLFSISACKST